MPAPIRVLVAGAGALGSCVALELARAGARVTLADPAALGENASGVAAGMLAPVFETLFDGGGPVRLALLRRALGVWPALAGSIGLSLDPAGAMAVGGAGRLDVWEGELAGLDADCIRLGGAGARERAPWLATGLGAIWTCEDRRVQPAAALAASERALGDVGVRTIRAAVAGFRPGVARLDAVGSVAAHALVIATGHHRGLATLAPELAWLAPIKGQILRAGRVVTIGPIVRAAEGYVCPDAGGALIGATMQEGLDDTVIDPAASERLKAFGVALAPGLAAAKLTAAAGVRASTPDHLPLVGQSVTPGVWLAVGARRNGWLLAPLIAQGLARSLLGGAAGEPAFAPDRFGPNPPPN